MTPPFPDFRAVANPFRLAPRWIVAVGLGAGLVLSLSACGLVKSVNTVGMELKTSAPEMREVVKELGEIHKAQAELIARLDETATGVANQGRDPLAVFGSDCGAETLIDAARWRVMDRLTIELQRILKPLTDELDRIENELAGLNTRFAAGDPEAMMEVGRLRGRYRQYAVASSGLFFEGFNAAGDAMDQIARDAHTEMKAVCDARPRLGVTEYFVPDMTETNVKLQGVYNGLEAYFEAIEAAGNAVVRSSSLIMLGGDNLLVVAKEGVKDAAKEELYKIVKNNAVVEGVSNAADALVKKVKAKVPDGLDGDTIEKIQSVYEKYAQKFQERADEAVDMTNDEVDDVMKKAEDGAG